MRKRIRKTLKKRQNKKIEKAKKSKQEMKILVDAKNQETTQSDSGRKEMK